jgi:SAM-dependent methyltransferase
LAPHQNPNWEIEYRRELSRLVTFIPNKNVPIHNWFYFKEGFSRDFVLYVLNVFKVARRDVVLDPFCGVGTTLLSCKELGISSVGVDALPLMVFISSVKTRDYDLPKLKSDYEFLFRGGLEEPKSSNVKNFVKQFFKPSVLKEVLSFKEKIMNIKDENSRGLFLLALMSAAVKASYMYKDGAVLKVVKKPVPPFRKFFKRRCRIMLRDLELANLPRGIDTRVLLGDARKLDHLDDSSVDFVITSPPYLNKIEYTKAYTVEQELFLGGEKPELVRSCIGLEVRDLVSDKYSSLPPIARAYFLDMERAIGEMYRVVRKGGLLAVVVAGGVFPTEIVDSDLIISGIAEEAGFRVKSITAVNYRTAAHGKFVKLGSSRESIIFLEKPN